MPQRPDRPNQPDVTESDLEPVDSVSGLSPIPLDTVPILVPVPSAPELTPVKPPTDTLDEEPSLPRPARTLELEEQDDEPSEEQVADVPWPEPPKAKPASGSRAAVKSGAKAAAKPVDVVSDIPSRAAKKRAQLRGDGFEHFEPTGGGGDTQPDEVTTPRGRVEPLTIGLIVAGAALVLLLLVILAQALT